MCSSLYAASCITVCSKSWEHFLSLAIMFSYSIGEFSKFVSISDSDKKSSKVIRDTLEYNSTWYCCDSVVEATNKWAMYGSIGHPNRLLSACQERNFNNLLTQLLESRAPVRECFLVQIGQCIFHYQLLGALSHGLFQVFKERCFNLLDPNLGFFLLDHPLLSGLMGFNFSPYTALRSSVQLQSKSAAHLESEYVEVTCEGNLTTPALVRFGTLKKYKRFLSSCDPKFDWREGINKNPEFLYRKPLSTREELCWIMTKAHGPGVPSQTHLNQLEQ